MTEETSIHNIKYRLSPIDLEHPKNTHDFQIILTGTGKKVLEFGPASGYISKILKECGCHITGIEINPTYAKQAEEYVDKIIVGDAEILNLNEVLGSEKYDVILLGDFLEHLKEPIQLLKKLHRFLAPNGYIICSIPNIAHVTIRLKLLNGEFKYEPTGLLDETHLRFFTLDTILTMLEGSGFSMVELCRGIEDVNLAHRTDLKHYTIPEELMAAIMNDPESTTYQYIFRAIPAHTNNLKIREELLDFPKNIVTEKLKETLHYYKENLVGTLEKRILERDIKLIDLYILLKNPQIDDLYMKILNRHADEQGLQHYNSLLKSGKMTKKDVARALLVSEERKVVQAQKNQVDNDELLDHIITAIQEKIK